MRTQSEPEGAESEQLRIAGVEITDGDTALDDVADAFADNGFHTTYFAQLLIGEPFADVRAFLSVDGGGIHVGGDDAH